MARIQETFTVLILDNFVSIEHEGLKAFKDQDPQSRKDLEKAIRETITIDGKTEGFIPYANFEASVKWKVTGKDKTTKKEKQKEASYKASKEILEHCMKQTGLYFEPDAMDELAKAMAENPVWIIAKFEDAIDIK